MSKHFVTRSIEQTKKILSWKKSLQGVICGLLIAFSIFMFAGQTALAQEGACEQTGNVQAGEEVLLFHDSSANDTRELYIGVSAKDDNFILPEYYYATTSDRNSSAKHKINLVTGGTGDISDESLIEIQILPDYQVTWQPEDLDQNLLGAFSKTHLYYWSDYDENTHWMIKRTSDDKSGPIQYGEDVWLINEDYEEYMIPVNPAVDPENAAYLTTEPTPSAWQIQKTCPSSTQKLGKKSKKYSSKHLSKDFDLDEKTSIHISIDVTVD